jgi:hypothetical protein
VREREREREREMFSGMKIVHLEYSYKVHITEKKDTKSSAKITYINSAI